MPCHGFLLRASLWTHEHPCISSPLFFLHGWADVISHLHTVQLGPSLWCWWGTASEGLQWRVLSGLCFRKVFERSGMSKARPHKRDLHWDKGSERRKSQGGEERVSIKERKIRRKRTVRKIVLQRSGNAKERLQRETKRGEATN